MSMIERKLVLKAPLAKVWGLIGTPEGHRTWFKANPIGIWAVGEKVKLEWPSGNSNDIRIVGLEEPSYFAYQWHPGDYKRLEDYPEDQLTTVSFRLREVEGGTEVHLTETGFDNVPDDRRLTVLGLNTEGWDEELESIRSHAEA